MMLADGTVHIGDWNHQGQRHGQGISLFRDGSKIEGTWTSDKLNGTARLIKADGSFYRGCWQDNLPHGLGEFCSANYRFTGQIEHDF